VFAVPLFSVKASAWRDLAPHGLRPASRIHRDNRVFDRRVIDPEAALEYTATSRCLRPVSGRPLGG